MGGDSTPPEPREPTHPLPWIQALSITGLVVVALADLLLPDGEVSWHFYAALIGLVFGSIDQIWSRLRGGG